MIESGNLKKWMLGGVGFIALTLATYSLTEVYDEVTKRVGFGPRNFVPESLGRPRLVPPEVKSVEKKTGKEIETGSVVPPRFAPKEEEAVRQARARCQKEKAKAIAEDEARILEIRVEWDKCLKAARWWPLFVGDPRKYCEPWERAKLGVEAGMEVARGWQC